MPEENEDGSEDLETPPAFFPYGDETADRPPGDYGSLVQVMVEGVFAAENNGQISRFVLLTDGERRLPISIGPFEAQAIQLMLEGERLDRPLTHDLIRNIMERVDTRLTKVTIDDYWNAVYYAKLTIKRKTEEYDVDARPSDAIALAMRFEASIFVADALLDGNDF
ncbi:bifunctional nuclease family protein [bacterium]|nr:MAG: bifunctional nuclease family protein [bacterium]